MQALRQLSLLALHMQHLDSVRALLALLRQAFNLETRTCNTEMKDAPKLLAKCWTGIISMVGAAVLVGTVLLSRAGFLWSRDLKIREA